MIDDIEKGCDQVDGGDDWNDRPQEGFTVAAGTFNRKEKTKRDVEKIENLQCENQKVHEKNIPFLIQNRRVENYEKIDQHKKAAKGKHHVKSGLGCKAERIQPGKMQPLADLTDDCKNRADNDVQQYGNIDPVMREKEIPVEFSNDGTCNCNDKCCDQKAEISCDHPLPHSPADTFCLRTEKTDSTSLPVPFIIQWKLLKNKNLHGFFSIFHSYG